MFDIRVICDPPETERVTKALATTFTLGPVRRQATRDGERMRLYITADYGPGPGDWPTPEAAYATAPSILSEIAWIGPIARNLAQARCPVATREFWLRKAAVLDRIALADSIDGYRPDAAEIATEAAERLLAVDRDGDSQHFGQPYWPEHPAAVANPRGYLRQEYAHWTEYH